MDLEAISLPTQQQPAAEEIAQLTSQQQLKPDTVVLHDSHSDLADPTKLNGGNDQSCTMDLDPSLLVEEDPLPDTVSSPQDMFLEINEQGMQLQEVLRMFKEATTKPLSSAIMQTPITNPQG